MKQITYSKHAEKRRKQRGYKPEEIEYVIMSPEKRYKRSDNNIEVSRILKNREIIVVYEEKANYINVVTII